MGKSKCKFGDLNLDWMGKAKYQKQSERELFPKTPACAQRAARVLWSLCLEMELLSQSSAQHPPPEMSSRWAVFCVLGNTQPFCTLLREILDEGCYIFY